MKTLSKDQIAEIKKNYPFIWVQAMLIPDKMDFCLSFMERHRNYLFTYTEVFFSPEGFAVYIKDGEERMFNLPTELFGTSPRAERDADGDWQKWLCGAVKVKDLK